MEVYGRILEYSNGIVIYVKSRVLKVSQRILAMQVMLKVFLVSYVDGFRFYFKLG
jgi:hypothetical protein